VELAIGWDKKKKNVNNNQTENKNKQIKKKNSISKINDMINES